MKLQYVKLDSALDLWPPSHFEFGFVAFGNGVSMLHVMRKFQEKD